MADFKTDGSFYSTRKKSSLSGSYDKMLRKGVRREMEAMEASNMRFKCEFPGCEREYGKKQHLKVKIFVT